MGRHGAATRERSIGDVDTVADRLLVERSQAGDREAFAELYSWYSGRLVRYCRAHLGDVDEAEDAAQEAFVRAWRALGTFAGERHFYPWLRVIAHNVCMDCNRRKRTTSVAENQLDRLTRPTPGGDEHVLAGFERELVLEAMGNLSPRHREVLELREQLNWTYQRIADHEGVAVSTIETLLFRARRALRKEFMALVGGDGAAALLFVRMRRGLGRLIGLHGPTVASATEAPVVVVRVATMGAMVAAVTFAAVAATGPHQHRGQPVPGNPLPAQTGRSPSGPSATSGALSVPAGSSAVASLAGDRPGRHRTRRAPAPDGPSGRAGSPDVGAPAAATPPPSSSTGSAGPSASTGTAGVSRSSLAGGSASASSTIAASPVSVPTTAPQAPGGTANAAGSALGDLGSAASAASQQLGAAASSALQAAATALGVVASTVNQVQESATAAVGGAITGSPTGSGGAASGGTAASGPGQSPAGNTGSTSGTAAATVTSTVASAGSAVNGAASAVDNAASVAGSTAGAAASTVGSAASSTVSSLAQSVGGLLGH